MIWKTCDCCGTKIEMPIGLPFPFAYPVSCPNAGQELKHEPKIMVALVNGNEKNPSRLVDLCDVCEKKIRAFIFSNGCKTFREVNEGDDGEVAQKKPPFQEFSYNEEENEWQRTFP